MDVSKWIADQARWAPHKVALRFEETSITYAELETRVARTAAGLQARAVRRGDRIAYLGPNCPELLELFFACARMGAIFVPLNARMPAPELHVFLEVADPAALVVEEQFSETAMAAAPDLTPVSIVTFAIGNGDLLARDATVAADPEADESAPVLILFTSGTTGTPKGAMHTNSSVISNAQDAINALWITGEDQVLTVLPMFHIAGLNVLTTPALSVGATVTLHRRFDAAAALEDIERCGITLFLAPPPMLVAMAADPKWGRTDLSSIRVLAVGGTIITEEGIRLWRERGVPITQGYGLTEAGPNVMLVPLAAIPGKTLTAGRPTLHTQLRIVDRDCRDLPRGERGEVLLRSPSVTVGYWRNPEATRDAISDGWLHTGDLGFIDNEGFLHIVDRIKEIIIVGISNVYPADVEAILMDSPTISDAAVVGMPDEEFGEVPVAFVVRAPGATVEEAHVLRLFEGRLAPYKHPRHVVFVNALPRTPIGKVEKKALRALARSRFLDEGSDGRLQLAAQ